MALQRRMDAGDAHRGPRCINSVAPISSPPSVTTSPARADEDAAANTAARRAAGADGGAAGRPRAVAGAPGASRRACRLRAMPWRWPSLAYGVTVTILLFALMPLAETPPGRRLDEARRHAERAVATGAHRAWDDPDLVTALGHLSEVLRDQGEGGSGNRPAADAGRAQRALSRRQPAHHHRAQQRRRPVHAGRSARVRRTNSPPSCRSCGPQAGADHAPPSRSTTSPASANRWATTPAPSAPCARCWNCPRRPMAHMTIRASSPSARTSAAPSCWRKAGGLALLLSRDIPAAARREIRTERARQLLHGEWMRRRAAATPTPAPYLEARRRGLRCLYPQCTCATGSVARA